MSRPPLVSVVVPNWNGHRWLPELLDALAAQAFRDFETVVVDNGSSDGSLELLRARAAAAAGPAPVLVELGRNRGFAAAVNRGVRAARGELLCLLNNDMFPEPGFLAALVAAAGAHPDAGSFACRVLFRDDPGRIDSAGDALLASGRSRGIGRGRPDGPEFDRPREVFGGTGGAVLYRRSVFEEAGGLDEDFFLYVEDTDLALRAQLLGRPCRYVPEARALHVGGGSIRGREDLRARYCLRNHLWLLCKSFPLRLALRHRGAVVRGLLVELLAAFGAGRVRHGAARAALLVAGTLLHALLGAPRMLARRLRLVRRVPPSAIEALLE